MRLLFLLSLLLSTVCHAQFTVSGIVRNSTNNKTLPFATITLSSGKILAADVDGKFTIENAETGQAVTLSYTGFSPETFTVHKNKRYYTVRLKPHTEVLDEVVINTGNPANAIIREAIRRKPQNNPEQKLNSFRYKTYNRLIVTAQPDSISGKLDSIYVYEKTGRRFEKIDSADFRFKKIVERRHLYQTEKISEYKYVKNTGLKEFVLATRMAGFKQPLYEIIGLKLQSYSVYSKNIDLLENKYEGPLADNAFADYHYKILDTLPIEGRKTYMVYFAPKRKKRKNLSGILYIDSSTYGVAKAVFRIKNVLDITSTHLFEFENKYGLWFPKGKTLKVVKGNNPEDIKILGETIKFDAVDKTDPNREKEASDYIYLLSESVNFEKEFNEPLSIKHKSVIIEIQDEAINRPETYWDTYRPDSLDTRSRNTYAALDSIVTKENIEYKIFLGKKIVNGYVPLGPFDLDLRYLAKYNNYEGFRLGAGGTTNDKFSEKFRVNGYGAYGSKDGEFKYSLGAAVRLGEFSNSWIGGSYTDDVREIASTSFATDKRVFKIYDPRPFNLTTFYNYQTWHAYIETRIIPKTESNWQVTRSRIEPKFNYIFRPGKGSYSIFNLTMATVSMQWNPFSDYMQTPNGKIETEKRFPKFTFQYTQAVSGVLDSDLAFGKFDFRTEYEKKYLNGQKTSFLIQSGLAVGDTPLTHLYSTSPNSLNKDAILQRVTLAGKNSFETMYFNEFFSSRYVIVQAKHALRRFTLIDQIKLSPVFVSRFAWGNMDHKEQHLGIDYNTLEKGYYESGLELNEIFLGFGISAFYRYGPYHLQEFDKNISVKLSFTLNLF
jgi:hypothetical protein